MHREPVGRAHCKPDGWRVQDAGLARPRAETAMGKRLGLRYSVTSFESFRLVHLAEMEVAIYNMSHTTPMWR